MKNANLKQKAKSGRFVDLLNWEFGLVKMNIKQLRTTFTIVCFTQFAKILNSKIHLTLGPHTFLHWITTSGVKIRFCLLKWWGQRGWGWGDESVEKENFKISFQKMLNEVLKSCKKWYQGWCKATRNKRTGSCICYFFIRSAFKTWNTIHQPACIFHLILLGIQSRLVLSVKKWGVGGFYLTDKIY